MGEQVAAGFIKRRTLLTAMRYKEESLYLMTVRKDGQEEGNKVLCDTGNSKDGTE